MSKRNSNEVNDKELGLDNKAYEADESGLTHRSSATHSEHKLSVNSDKAAIAAEEAAAPVEKRQKWGNQWEFLMSCIAMSVGLGNIWRFPFTAYDNGGGAFLIPYVIVLIIIGRPMYFLEMGLGQFTGYSAVKGWSVSPAMKGIGWSMFFASAALLSYYTSLMAITLFYFIASFNANLPWSVCDERWGGTNDTCYPSKPGSGEINRTGLKSSSELYFINEVLKEADNIDDGIGAPEWRLTLCLFVSWIVIFLVMIKGLKSSGKAAYFLALFPYVVLIILLIRGCTLPGAAEGILYFITPKWEELASPTVWYAAVTQAFFSLGISFGNLMMYASFNGYRDNIYRDTIIVTTIDTFTSMLAGCTIFAIVGNLAFEVDMLHDIGSVVKSDTGLAFITYPDAIAKFDAVPQLFAVIFFLMLFTLGVGSAMALTNNINAMICDQFTSLKRWHVLLGVSICGFLIGLIYVTPGGQWMLTLVDEYCVTFVAFVVTVTQITTISWIYGMEKFMRDLQVMLNKRFNFYWRICWAVITPIVLIIILLYWAVQSEAKTYNGKKFPEIAYILAWILASLGVGQIPFWIGVRIWSRKDLPLPLKDIVLGAFKPSPKYGPKNPDDRKEWVAYKQRKKEEDAARNDSIFKKAGRQLGGCWETK